MSRFLLSTALVIALAAAGRVQGQPAGPAAPPLEKRVGRTITVAQANRPAEKCYIEQVWRTPDGRPAMRARSLETGEMMTILETPHASAAADRFRVFRWGQDGTPPPGTPLPPPTTTQSATPPPAAPTLPVAVRPTPPEPRIVQGPPAEPRVIVQQQGPPFTHHQPQIVSQQPVVQPLPAEKPSRTRVRWPSLGLFQRNKPEPVVVEQPPLRRPWPSPHRHSARPSRRSSRASRTSPPAHSRRSASSP